MEKPKNIPFKVPEAYFESFPDRLTERIREMESEQVPVRKLGGVRKGLLVAAAVAVLALVTFPLVRVLSPEPDMDFIEIALLEDAGVFSSDYDLASYLEGNGSGMDDEEAFVNQAIDYLASTDVEMSFIFE